MQSQSRLSLAVSSPLIQRCCWEQLEDHAVEARVGGEGGREVWGRARKEEEFIPKNPEFWWLFLTPAL